MKENKYVYSYGKFIVIVAAMLLNVGLAVYNMDNVLFTIANVSIAAVFPYIYKNAVLEGHSEVADEVLKYGIEREISNKRTGYRHRQAYSIAGFIDSVEEIEGDLGLALSSLYKNGTIRLINENNNSASCDDVIYVVQLSPFKVEFRNTHNHQPVNVESLSLILADEIIDDVTQSV